MACFYDFAPEALSRTPIVNGDSVMGDCQEYKLFFSVLEKEQSVGVSVVGREAKVELVPWLAPSPV